MSFPNVFVHILCIVLAVFLFVVCSMKQSNAADPEPSTSFDSDYTNSEDPSEAPIEEPTPEPEREPLPGEVSDGKFKSYVLGCLFFFVLVILAYFIYKFFNMFF